MKRLLFPFFLLFPIALLAQTAKIKIDIDRTIAEIDPFTYDKQDRYAPVTKEIQVEGNHISYSFPAHSFTQIKIGVKK